MPYAYRGPTGFAPLSLPVGRVRAIPTQVLLDDEGREVYRHLGFLSAQAIRERFTAHGMPLAGTTATP